LRINDLSEILAECEVPLSAEVVAELFRLSDHDRDYALHLNEFIWMMKSYECNKLYSKHARALIREKLRKSKLDLATNHRTTSLMNHH
jgi:Ca2+-binding EF-hand superfamily protein